MPYFDSPSLFAKILDRERGRSFKIEGIDTVKTSQEYARFTPILKTRVETSEGAFDIYDFMPRFVADGELEVTVLGAPVGRIFWPARRRTSRRTESLSPCVRPTPTSSRLPGRRLSAKG